MPMSGTLRLKLLKVGAVILRQYPVECRFLTLRVLVPTSALFFHVAARLAPG